jgi:hypothetical protein
MSHLPAAQACADVYGLLPDLQRRQDAEVVDLGPLRALIVPGSPALVAFRGTDPHSLTDWMTDAACELISTEYGRIHCGFLHAAQVLWPQIESRISGPVILTGHSLGAAIAAVCATWTECAELITFGQPRTGDREFVARLNTLPYTRYVNHRDPVCEVPAVLPPGYVHGGCIVRFDGYGRVAVMDLTAAITEAVRTGSDLLAGNWPDMTTALADHHISAYLAAVRMNGL